VKQSRYVPFWAVQFFVGALIVLFAVALVAALVGTAVRGPTAFFDELGKTVSRVAPQPAADIRDEAQLKAVIRSMPEGRIRVGAIVEEQDRVVFTITADRAAVHAAVRAGDELRLARDGSVEIAPTGIPGLVDRLQRALDELKRRFFGP
jgi:hypothetical protein